MEYPNLWFREGCRENIPL